MTHFQTPNFRLTYMLFPRDRNRNGGSLILYMKENILIGDFNMTVTAENSKINELMNNFSLEYLIKEPTCYISNTPICIDLMLIDPKRLFLKLSTFERGLPDFRKLTTAILRKTILKVPLKRYSIKTTNQLIKTILKMIFRYN